MSDGAGTRSRLLEAAVEVFAEDGYEGARVQEIARRAGLTTGAIYAQFRNKAELLQQAIECSSGAGLESLLATVAAGEPLSAANLLAALGDHLLDAGRPGDSVLIEALVAAKREPEVADVLRALLDEHSQQLAGLFSWGKKAGVLDKSLSTDAAVRFCLA